jgi:hypothetical protein
LTPELNKTYLEFEFIDKSTNIKDYILRIFDSSNNLIDVINQTSNLNREIVLPKVIIAESKTISKIEIIILSTTNKNPPIHVKISLKGYNNNDCQPIITTTPRTTPSRPSTTILSSTTTKTSTTTPAPITSTTTLTSTTPSRPSTTILSSTTTKTISTTPTNIPTTTLIRKYY